MADVTFVTFEHDGVLYDVIDWHFVGLRRVQTALNSPHAEGRAFVPRDRSAQVRIFPYRGGINYQRSDPATLAQQFSYSIPVRWER